MTEDRKLATIRVIQQLKPIKNADLIEVAVIDGWEVVIKKNEFNVGDLCVYLEIDSWVPHELAPFLSKGKEPREYKGIKGERLRTIKLKGQISQGLVLPLNDYTAACASINDDLTENLNILKWEREIPAQLAGKMAGNFPSFIPKTDQERIQNCIYKIQNLGPQTWEVTEKLDGSSMTVFRNTDGRRGVCSRNYELKLEDTENTFVKVTLNSWIHESLTESHLALAFQGELIGPGIQGNSYKLNNHEFYIFDIYNIPKQRYLTYTERKFICTLLNLKHAPVYGTYATDENTTVEELLGYAKGISELYPTHREGVVFKNINDPSLSFKVISNEWLLKNE